MTLRTFSLALVLGSVCSIAEAQEPAWVIEVSVGYAGFVDDATKNYWLYGGSVRRAVTPRISIGPEVVVMSNSGRLRDRMVLVTGNVVVDAVMDSKVKPFVVVGVGTFRARERFPAGPYWSSDPAFTAGGGVRARAGNSLSLAAEYRIGWELHQRVSGSAAFHW